MSMSIGVFIEHNRIHKSHQQHTHTCTSRREKKKKIIFLFCLKRNPITWGIISIETAIETLILEVNRAIFVGGDQWGQREKKKEGEKVELIYDNYHFKYICMP